MGHNVHNHSWSTFTQSIENFFPCSISQIYNWDKKETLCGSITFYESDEGGGGAYLSVMLICLFTLLYGEIRDLLRKRFLLECELCFLKGIMALVLSVLSVYSAA